MLKDCRRLFYPHTSNNYKAGLLQPPGLCLLIALFLLAQSFLNLTLGSTPGVLGFTADITPEEIIELTNKKRTAEGITPLNINDKLSEAARQKAADMFALNYWSHVSPRGVDPWSFIANAGYSYLYAGENLARDFYSADGVVDAWMNSPTHRDNILSQKYQDIGVAVVGGILQGQETTLVVQMFATPTRQRSPTIEQETAVIETPPLSEEREVFLLSGFDLTRSFSLAFAGLLFIVLALDGLIIWRKKITRLSGHNFIHGTFVIILIVIILLSQRGAIL